MIKRIVIALESIADSLIKIVQYGDEARKHRSLQASKAEHVTEKIESHLFSIFNKFIEGGK